MLRLSKLTDYAVVVMIRLADGDRSGCRRQLDDTIQTSPGIALATGVPEPTVAKVLKLLAASGLVVSMRGAHGGYRLARPLAQVTVADIITAVDGPIALTACVDGGAGSCDVEAVCVVKGRWDLVNDSIRTALNRITLADMNAASIPAAFRVTGPAFEAPVHAAAE